MIKPATCLMWESKRQNESHGTQYFADGTAVHEYACVLQNA